MTTAVFRLPAIKSVDEHVIELQRIWRKKHRVGKIEPESILKAWTDLAASVKSSEFNKAPLFINILPIDQKNTLFAKTQETLHRWINELEQIRAAIYAEYRKSIGNLDWALIISRTLLSTLEDKTWQGLKNTFLQVVWDNDGQIQAIVIYSFDKDEDTNEEVINIHHLCTAPQNLERGDKELADLINPHHKKIVKGAASALIEFVASECLKKGFKGISLAPCDSSIKFYETLGFQKTEYGDMTMSEEGIKQFIAKRAQIITQKKGLQRSSAPLLEVLKETKSP